MKLYKIKNWDQYENFRSRRYDSCRFLSFPTKQDGLGYKILSSMTDGAALYGCFVAVCLIAAKQKNPRQGCLTISGQPHDKPFSCAELSLKCNLPIGKLKRMLTVCSSPRIGINWIECTSMMWFQKLNSRHYVPSTTCKSESILDVSSTHPASILDVSSTHPAGILDVSSTHPAGIPVRSGKVRVQSNNARARAKIELDQIAMKPEGRELLDLISRCNSLFSGTREMKKWHQRWYDRAKSEPEKLNRVLAHVEEFQRSGGKINKSLPALVEHTWHEFA